MSTLRTFNLQNPDSGTVNIEMDQGGNTLMTGIATVRGAAHFTSTSGSDAVGIGTDITAYKLDVRVTGSEAGLRVYNPDTSSNASGIIRLGNDDNQNSAFLKLNGANNSSTVGGAANLVLGTGTAREVHLATNGTSRLQIDSSGNVLFDTTNTNPTANNADGTAILTGGGIRVSRDGEPLGLNRGGSDGIFIDMRRDGTSKATMGVTSNALQFSTGGSERLRITSGGLVGVNCTPLAQFQVKTGTNQNIALSSMSSEASIEAFNDAGSANVSLRLRGSNFKFYTSSTERLRIDSTGSIYAGGSVITEADMNWGHDTYQRPHIFTGQSGGNPADGVVVVASAETNPGATRIGSLVYGCKTSSSVGAPNSGIKAYIDCHTNTNVSDAWKTGAYVNFATRADNGSLNLAQRISSDGEVTKPLQPAFRALTTGFSKNNGWQKITFGTENYDIGGNYDHANNKFTAPVAGRYVFYAGGWSSSTSTDSRYAFCARVNGGGLHYLAGAHYGNVDSPMAGYYVIHNLAANDYVEMWGYSAVSATWGGGSHYMFWGGYLLG